MSMTGALIGLTVSAWMASLGSCASAAADHSTSRAGRIGLRIVAIAANVTQVAAALVSSNFIDDSEVSPLEERLLQATDAGLAFHGVIELARNMISLYNTDMLPPQNQEQPQVHDNPAYEPDEDQDQAQTQTSAL